MINFIVLGKCRRVTSAVLQSIRSFTDAKCIVIGGPETRILRWSALCKRQITVDLEGKDDNLFVDLVNSIVRQRPHVILIPVDCDAIRLVSRVRARLMLPVTPIPELATLNMFDDKWQFHQFCTSHDLAVPQTRFVPSKADLDYEAMVEDIGSPFLLKPLGLAGSTGVYIVHDKADFEQAVLHNDAYDYGPLVAQQYIEGDDVDISLLALGGRVTAFAIQQAGDSSIVFRPSRELEAMAAKLCEVSSYHGVMHIDARIETASGKVYLIESNPRFWASLTASVWCGLNFAAQVILPAYSTSGVRHLTSGTAYTRYPLIRPSCWKRMVLDTSERGRLLRAMTFDPLAFSDFIKELPAACWRLATARVAGLTGGLRRTRTSSAFAKDIA